MEKLLLNNKLYSLYRFENEAEFERVIVKNVADISDLDTIVVPALEGSRGSSWVNTVGGRFAYLSR